MVREKIKNYHKPILMTLLGGVALMPVQGVFTHDTAHMSPSDVAAMVISEQHTPHRVGHHFNDYYADPRAIRAIGYDSGKTERQKDGRDNWDFYIEGSR